jgi:Rrf2 family protein
LARPGLDGNSLRVREIADAHGIPERYLVQILLQLKASGLVHSTRGSIGGYRLARSPEEITIADVIIAIEGPAEPRRKLGSDAARELNDLIEIAWNAQREILGQAKIAQFAERTGIHDYVL